MGGTSGAYNASPVTIAGFWHSAWEDKERRGVLSALNESFYSL